MNLLLLLSAFLTALSGAIGGARAVQGAEAHRVVGAAAVAVVPVPAVAQRRPARPAQPWTTTVSAPPALAALRLAAAVPAYAARRRE